MSGLPTKVDRMPRETNPRLPVKHAIALALTQCDEKWAGRLLSEDSRPVHAVLETLDKAGWKIVEK